MNEQLTFIPDETKEPAVVDTAAIAEAARLSRQIRDSRGGEPEQDVSDAARDQGWVPRPSLAAADTVVDSEPATPPGRETVTDRKIPDRTRALGYTTIAVLRKNLGPNRK